MIQCEATRADNRCWLERGHTGSHHDLGIAEWPNEAPATCLGEDTLVQIEVQLPHLRHMIENLRHQPDGSPYRPSIERQIARQVTLSASFLPPVTIWQIAGLAA